jgi:hypothetical protein
MLKAQWRGKLARKPAVAYGTSPAAILPHYIQFGVKEMTLDASIPVTVQDHKVNGSADQALVGAIMM